MSGTVRTNWHLVASTKGGRMARRRVHGPYKHGFKWRLILVGEDGTQDVDSFGSKDEAEAEKLRLQSCIEEHEGVTVTQALDQYELWMRQKGNKPRSIATTRSRIAKFFGDHCARRVNAITEAMGVRLYDQLQGAVSVDTHRNALNESKTFFNWCIAKPRQWLRKNPLNETKGAGKRKKGKPQLRIDESRRFIETAHTRAKAGHVDGVVALASLYFGTRITELVVRPVRDLDDEGWLLWIPDSKTENGKRFLEVPEDLRPYLLALAKGKDPDANLFGKVSRYQAREWVIKVCKLAGVPTVSPHGLRGTHTTIARERGVTPMVIAAAVGHGSYDAVTKQNYVAPGTDERARQRVALGVIQGGKRGNG